MGYNISNRKVLSMVGPLTWTEAFLQLFIGILYVIPTGCRRCARLQSWTQGQDTALIPVAVLHLLTHMCAIISLGAAAVSFTHIVKVAQPAVSTALSAAFLRSFLDPLVYQSLLPVMGGVALASMKELSFTWLGFGAAMLSNVASTGRGIMGNANMDNGNPAKTWTLPICTPS